MKKKETAREKPVKATSLSFEEAMKKILHTPKEAVDKAIKKAKKSKVTKTT
jgi:hypothetical protein